MKKIVTTKQLEVPLSTMIAVADLLIANEITHQIVETDEENDTITIEVEYSREERDTIHEIEDLIDDEEEEEDEDEDEDDDN